MLLTPLRRDNRCHNRTVSVDEARAALDRGDWRRALELLAGENTDDSLQIRAAASYGAGDLEGTVAAWETLHLNRRTAGDVSGAAWAACMVALHLLIDSGLMSPIRAWVRRAEELLSDLDDDPASAVVAMVRTYERFMSGDAQESRRQAERAVFLGQRLGVRAAVVIGHTALGRLLIIEGEVAEGLMLLDDVAVELMGSDVDALTTGMMYCELICAAQGLGRHDLARDWTELMDRWRHGAALGGIHGRCRVHRAELLRLSGPAEAAEQEALSACDELRPWMRREFGWPLVELGNIRRVRGDLDGAEEAFLEAHRLVWSPQPGLALLRLEQGHPEVAAVLIADAIEYPEANPSKEQPPFGDLRLAPLLAAQVEIAAACGDLPTVRRATGALADISSRYDSPTLQAESNMAHARLALLEGRLDDAVIASSSAIDGWGELGAPVGTGTARVLRGRAHQLAGNTSCATLDWTAARRDFETFGSPRAVTYVTTLLQEADAEQLPAHVSRVGDDTGNDSRHITFARTGECRRIVWGSTEILTPDLKGFRYLHQLLKRAGGEIHVMDLVSTELSTTRPHSVEPGLTSGFQTGLPLLDDQARDAYRRRLAEVEEEIDDADAAHDLGRLALAESDREHLVAELTRAFGIDGRPRTVGDDVERARGSVTRSLRYALRRLRELQPELGEHLDQHVRTGTYCSYRPDPITPVTWELG